MGAYGGYFVDVLSQLIMQAGSYQLLSPFLVSPKDMDPT